MDQVDTYLMTGISSSACLTIRYDKGPVDSTLCYFVICHW